MLCAIGPRELGEGQKGESDVDGMCGWVTKQSVPCNVRQGDCAQWIIIIIIIINNNKVMCPMDNSVKCEITRPRPRIINYCEITLRGVPSFEKPWETIEGYGFEKA